MVRTRFAPSPTGYLHIGGARTALFNYLFAKNRGGQFVLRIEDTDQIRSTKEFSKQVISSLTWLGLLWDEGPGVEGPYGPYYQSLRKCIYQKYIDLLLEKGLAYPCFCSDEHLQKKKRESEALGIPNVYEGTCTVFDAKTVIQKKSLYEGKYVYRFRFPPKAGIVSFRDVLRGEMKIDSKLLGDFVILKSDGLPTYNFAVVIDDALMKITHVLRGDDHLTNTFRQVILYKYLGFELPEFYHISMICGADGSKLSKRHGAQSVLEFQEKGYLQEPLLNFLCLLGWTPEDFVEIMDFSTLIKKFDGKKFSKSPAIFDYDKLDFFNGQYIRSLSKEKSLNIFLPYLQDFFANFSQGKVFLQNKEILQNILEMVQNYCKTINDISKHLSMFIDELFAIDSVSISCVEEKNARSLLELSVSFLEEKDQQYFAVEILKELQLLAKQEYGIQGPQFFKPLRTAFCGKSEGIALDKLFTFFSKESLLYRLKKTLASLE